ncbi:MAG: sulfotransferase family 2 domain-containing protein [Syntrophotaleaceae bacterium]
MDFVKQLPIIQNRKNPVILDRLERFIFFPNNKVCQRSITREALADRVLVRKHDQVAWEQKFSTVDEEYFSRVFTFTIVRNPYDRAVSAFAYLQKTGKIDKRYTFKDFCAEVLSEKGIAFDPHFDPQSDGLFCDGKLIPQFLARFESIQEDWSTIAAAIDGPLSLPHINKSKRRKTYSDYYDHAARELITDLYRDDLANFDYQFEQRKKRFFWF